MNPINVKLITCIDFGVEKDKDLKFKVGDHVQIPKYKSHIYKRLHSRLVWRKLKILCSRHI